MRLNTSILLIGIILMFSHVYAQQPLPPKGEITTSDIQLKECTFDKDADAVIILDDGFTDYSDNGGMVTKRRLRMKILSEKGIENGDIAIPYYSYNDYELIDKVEGTTYNLDASGNILKTSLDEKTIFKQKRNIYYSEVRFAMPAIKIGSIIEYSYESNHKYYSPRYWDFQAALPVMRSCYLLQIPPDVEFSYSIQKKKQYGIEIKPIADKGMVYFEMKNIPGFQYEPFMDAAGDYIQRVLFQFSGMIMGGYRQNINKDWKSVAYDLMTDKEFGSQLDKPVKVADLQSLVDANSEPSTRLHIIYKYVRDNIGWNGIYSKHLTQSFKTMLEKKQASSGELNLLLVNLLKSHGLQAYPMLVAERDFGKIDTTYPFLEQFNKVVAYVKVGGKQYILDATQKKTPFELTPEQLLNTIGFLVDRKNYALIQIASSEKSAKNRIQINGTLDEKGLLKGHAIIKSFDYTRVSRAEALGQDRRKFIAHYFLEPYEGLVIDSIEFKNNDREEEPLEQVVEFNQQLQEQAGIMPLKYNLFTGLVQNPFSTSIRFSDINFGHPYDITLEARFKINKGLKIEELPKEHALQNIQLGIRVSRQMKIENDELYIMIAFSQFATFVSVDNYNVVKDFYKQMIDLLNEPVIITEN